MIREEIIAMSEKAKKRKKSLGIIAVNIIIVVIAAFLLVCAYGADNAFKGLTDDDLTRCKVSNVEQKFIEKKVTKDSVSDDDGFDSMRSHRHITYVFDVSCDLTFTFLGKERTYPYTFRHEVSDKNWKTELYDGMEKDFFVVVDVDGDCLSSVRFDRRESVPVYRMVFLILAGVTALVGIIIDVVIFIKIKNKRSSSKNKLSSIF